MMKLGIQKHNNPGVRKLSDRVNNLFAACDPEHVEPAQSIEGF
jgi:hypothetical protein